MVNSEIGMNSQDGGLETVTPPNYITVPVPISSKIHLIPNFIVFHRAGATLPRTINNNAEHAHA